MESTAADIEDLELGLLLEAVYQRHHYDFRNYARASLRRRARVAMNQLQCANFSDLQARILRDEDAFTTLLQCLTVQVTDMFRDAGFFLTFRREVVPMLRTYPSIRLWVAGCSTGEELYSYAVILREEGLLDRSILYGTDINQSVLRTAEAGIYSLERIRLFTQNHRKTEPPGSLSEHYSSAYDSAVFDRELRRHTVFADHNLATDSAFAEVQVVSCRNVLIYFDGKLNARALNVFDTALCRRGFLGIGSRETLQASGTGVRFKALIPGQRWYQKR